VRQRYEHLCEKRRRHLLKQAYLYMARELAMHQPRPASYFGDPRDLSRGWATPTKPASTYSRILPAVRVGMMACPYCGERGWYPCCEAEVNDYRASHILRPLNTPFRNLIPRSLGKGVAVRFSPLIWGAPPPDPGPATSGAYKEAFVQGYW
jgi:hypothetical protein